MPNIDRPRFKRSPNLVEAMRLRLKRNMWSKITKMAMDFTMSTRAMGRLIKEDLKMKSYHLQCHQLLLEAMKLKRVDWEKSRLKRLRSGTLPKVTRSYSACRPSSISRMTGSWSRSLRTSRAT